MSSFQLLFYLFAVAALIGGVGVVWARNVVHSALFLILSLLAVAGLYLVLFADFLFLVQILIYGGAVTILILFAMMLTRVRDYPNTLDNPQKPWAIAASVFFLAVMVFTIYQTPWANPGAENLERVPFGNIGISLFTQWVIPFEVASLVLLVALMGAIIIARGEDRE